MKREILIATGLVAALATAAFVRPPRAAAPALTMAAAITPSAERTHRRRGERSGCTGCHGERSERKRAKSNHARSTRRPPFVPIDVNLADASQLATVPGVTAELARRIVA